MSGGVAYVWDRAGDFNLKCNLGLVELEAVEGDEDIAELREMIEMHQNCTGSTVAEYILNEWPEVLKQFKKVMPTDYKRVLMAQQALDTEEEMTEERMVK
jgi:glutamate synthase domain-containing protein 3